MTFRSRLLLVIIAVVVFTTAVSLLVAQRQNSAAYRTLGDELLGNQVQAFQRAQQSRHEQALELTGRLADSVRLFAALEAEDPEVYKIADDELRLGEISFFRLLDADGKPIAPPEDAPPRYASVEPESALVPSARTAMDQEDVQLGFVEVASGNAARPSLYRLLAAPIRSFDRQVGTLLLGQRVTGMTEPAGNEATLPVTHSALWIEDRPVGGDVPRAVRGALGDALRLAREDTAELDVGDSSYRYQRTLLNPGSAYPPAYLISLVSMEGFVAGQRALLLRIVLTGLAASLLAALFAFALSRQLARPIADLVSATRRIREGDYAHRLAPSATREFDQLADAFNEMAADLALKERYRSVLQQVADTEIANELVAGRVKLGGELREVTVMFCDIRGYTEITVGRAPEAVIALLNAHLGALSRIVHAHRGVINQFAGDSIMALFGAPKQYGDDAERAVRCACAMMDERERLNTGAEIPIRVGIGIATGSMVAGCIGAEQRSDYTVVGERVNLAARLSGAAAAGEVLVDDTTRARLEGVIEADPMPPLELKGFGRGVPAFRVRRDRSDG